jgi:hypothetical protein
MRSAQLVTAAAFLSFGHVGDRNAAADRTLNLALQRPFSAEQAYRSRADLTP